MKFQVLLLSLLLSANGFAAEKTVIRIGVQSGGTVEWELPALQGALKAKQADITNSSGKPDGSSCQAAAFLKNFVEKGV